MIEEPKLEVTVDKLGHETYRISHNGVILDKEQAEYVAERIKRLEQENDELRSMVKAVLVLIHDPTYEWLDATLTDLFGKGFTEQARELGIEVD